MSSLFDGKEWAKRADQIRLLFGLAIAYWNWGASTITGAVGLFVLLSLLFIEFAHVDRKKLV